MTVGGQALSLRQALSHLVLLRHAYLSASSVMRTPQAPQITACCLYKLRKSAYDSYSRDASQSSEDVLKFEEWCEKQRLESPQFAFWSLILAMELAILTLIRSLREADLVLYREALSDLNPYFFTNNNINYARWIPVYLRDIHKWPETFTRETSWFTNLAENFQPFQFLNVGARKTVPRGVNAFALD